MITAIYNKGEWIVNTHEEYMNKLVDDCKNPIPEDRITALLEKGSVDLSLDGNCGCALLGPDLQEGEAEFVEVDYNEFDDEPHNAEKRAIVRALNKLKARCGGQSLPYNTCLCAELF